MSRNTLISIFLFIAILVFFSVTYYHEMLFMWPGGIHDWAQSDRLSLAMNFYDRGMNFFKPATHNLWPEDGITGVEFPIQSYVAALAGKFLGRNHISTCFRLIDVVISCTGLLFLFLACYRATKDFIFSLVPPLFMYCSPIYVYYTCNYLPDAAACSISFIAFYFLLEYIDTSLKRSLVCTIALLTLATLIKTSVGIYLLGFMGYVFLQRVLRRDHFNVKDNVFYVFACAVSLTLVIGYALYNRYLNETYHSSVFLAKVRPFKSWDEVSYYFNSSFKFLWIDEYFVLPQYLMLVAIVAPGIAMLTGNAAGKKRILMLLIFLAGCICMGYLMGSQLLIHDYYVVSIFLPFFAFAMLVSVIAIFQGTIFPVGRRALRISFFAGVLIIFFFSDFHIHQRLRPDFKGINPGIPWAAHGAIMLDELHVPKSEKMLVLGEDAPNIALVYFDRRGYNTPPDKWKKMEGVSRIMNQLGLKLVACEENMGRNIVQYDSTFAQHFTVLALKDRIALFQLTN